MSSLKVSLPARGEGGRPTVSQLQGVSGGAPAASFRLGTRAERSASGSPSKEEGDGGAAGGAPAGAASSARPQLLSGFTAGPSPPRAAVGGAPLSSPPRAGERGFLLLDVPEEGTARRPRRWTCL